MIMGLKEKLLLKINPKIIIEKSAYFDKDWYKEKYQIEEDPAAHYLNEGWQKEYNPSERFSSKDYLINNPDISGINPLVHYEVFGRFEGRRPFIPRSGNVSDYDLEDVELNYEKYCRTINEKKIISFDVFDTLVNRPFYKADDLFKYLEIKYEADDFYKVRKEAEKKARKELKKEVNLDEIYQFIDEKYKFLYDKEIEYEIKHCHINPLIRPIYEEAKESGKRVIAVSDMYLDETVIGKILDKSLYQMDKIYVSCNLNKTKGSGELFRYVIEKEGVNPDEIVHFGDNYISDYSEAVSNGLSAYQTPKIVDHVLSKKDNKFVLSFMNMHKSLSSSAYIAQFAEHQNEESFFTKLGYNLGGPLASGYLYFICERAKEKNIDKLLFVSRDGYILKYLYEKYFYEKYLIPCAYAYLSRAAIFAGTKENGLCNDKTKFLSIAKLFNIDSENLEDWSKERSYYLRKHLEMISENSKNIATVDMFSGNYTSQKGAEYYLKNRIGTGFYAGNFAECEINHDSFCKRLLGMRDNLPVKMSEFLISSFESPVVGVDLDGKPVYENETSELKIKRYEEIKKGIVEYFDDYSMYFDIGKEYLLTVEEWLDLCDCYLRECPDKDLESLTEIIDSENPVSRNDDKNIRQLIELYREKGY